MFKERHLGPMALAERAWGRVKEARSEQKAAACPPLTVDLSLFPVTVSNSGGWQSGHGVGQWRAEFELWTPAPSFLGSLEKSPGGQGLCRPAPGHDSDEAADGASPQQCRESTGLGNETRGFGFESQYFHSVLPPVKVAIAVVVAV